MKLPVHERHINFAKSKRSRVHMQLLLRFKLLTMYHIFALFAMRSAWDGRRYMGAA